MTRVALIALIVGCSFPEYQVGGDPVATGGGGKAAGGAGAGGGGTSEGGAATAAGQPPTGGSSGGAPSGGSSFAVAGAEAAAAAGAAGESGRVVTRDITSSGTPIALILHPGGGGNISPEVMRNGDLPAEGSQDLARQYDTFTGDPTRTEDWLGYAFDAPRSFTRVVFQNGILFDNGGWFDSIKVQVQDGEIWVDVDASITPVYPGAAGPNYGVYQFDFAAVTGVAVRVFGAPGGQSRFVSCGELRVFDTG